MVGFLSVLEYDIFHFLICRGVSISVERECSKLAASPGLSRTSNNHGQASQGIKILESHSKNGPRICLNNGMEWSSRHLRKKSVNWAKEQSLEVGLLANHGLQSILHYQHAHTCTVHSIYILTIAEALINKQSTGLRGWIAWWTSCSFPGEWFTLSQEAPASPVCPRTWFVTIWTTESINRIKVVYADRWFIRSMPVELTRYARSSKSFSSDPDDGTLRLVPGGPPTKI